MQLGGSEFIALLALLVSVASVFYSKKAVDVARENMRAALHQPRREIFEEIFSFRSLFVGMDFHPTRDEIQNFYQRVILPAHLYLSSELGEKLYELYRKSLELSDEIESSSDEGLVERKWACINELQQLGKKDLDNLIREVVAELQLKK